MCFSLMDDAPVYLSLMDETLSISIYGRRQLCGVLFCGGFVLVFLSHGIVSLACKECSLMVRYRKHDFCSWLPLQCGSELDR